MATKINARLRHKRGTEGSIPTLVDGQIYLCTDTHRIYKGTSTGENILISDINKLNTIYNDNLLINGDFQVWQRGTHFENVGIGQYQADRWQVNSSDGNYLATVDKVDEGLKVIQDSSGGAKCVIQYRFEDSDFKRINGKVCTLSKSINGAIESYQITPTTNIIQLEIGSNVTVNWIKLELGTVATPFIPRPYAEELALCQRYYEVVEWSGKVVVEDNTALGADYKVKKRIRPSVKIYSYNDTENAVNKWSLNDVTYTVDFIKGSVDGIQSVTCQTGSILKGEVVVYKYVADAEIYN